jgi:CO/xanthine dehydrogenase FAD-binding subunit
MASFALVRCHAYGGPDAPGGARPLGPAGSGRGGGLRTPDSESRHAGRQCCAWLPTADPPAALIALGAVAHIRGSAGERSVPIEDFFVGFMQTVLTPNELLAELVIPPQP